MARYAYHRLDANHKEIREALEAMGATVTTTNPGDLIVGFRGRNYLLEAKTKTGKQRPGQVKFQARWKGQYAVIRTFAEAMRVLDPAGDW